MSYATFLASDIPMPDMENPHQHSLISTKQPYYFTDDYGNPPDTDLPCFSELNWKYSEERANKLIGYIRKHLETATVLEILNYWIGSGRNLSEGMKKHNVGINEFTLADLEKLFSYGTAEEYDCLVIKRK